MILKYVLLAFLLTSCASYKGKNSFKKQENLSYGAHSRQVGDLYLTDAKEAPLILTIHGGSWSNRSHHDMTNIAESLATNGYNVFNISYRFAPQFKHPSPIEDLSLAIAFIKKSQGEKLKNKKIGLWGYSSGAHTALMYGLKEENSVVAIVAGGGPYDFTWWPNSPIVTPYMGYARDENIEGWLEASPVSLLTKNSPSLFLYHGKEDELVEHSQMTALDARAKLMGIDSETHTVSFWGHATTFVFSNEAIQKAILFLNKRFKEQKEMSR